MRTLIPSYDWLHVYLNTPYIKIAFTLLEIMYENTHTHTHTQKDAQMQILPHDFSAAL